ncbi:MAG: NAD(P)/FAD-dependent oxidoreductase [Pseudomonadota bacterium]
MNAPENLEATRWLESFAAALSQRDARALAALFAPDCFWRDLLAFTWDIRTHEGTVEGLLSKSCSNWKLEHFPVSNPSESWFSFSTAEGPCVGHVRLHPGENAGRAWTLFTALRGLHAHPERPLHALAREPDLGVTRQPYVVIVGGGQGGIALGARLKRLGVPAVILEKNARAGDSWRKRYASLVLHDPVWYDHMPCKPFPQGWPVFTPKDRLADWLEAYVEEFGLDYWCGSPCLGAVFKDGFWEVRTERKGVPAVLRPRHLVLATGMSGFPYVPRIPGAADFSGTILHSSAFTGGAGWRGKKCVVVGASTSAHDICEDLHAHGAHATMVQRSSVVVATSEALLEHAWGRLYSEAALARGITTEIADLTLASVPHKVLPSLQKPLYETIARRDAWLYDGLARAGFLHDFGEDGSGIHTCYLRRGAGYYIETGASKKIIDGRIKLASGAGLAHINERSLTLTDGRTLPADLIVFATGYGCMSEWAAQLISPEVAEKVGKVWGLGSATKYDPGPWEGELRNMWKPTKQEGLWFFGGNLMQARHYSLYLGIQLRGRLSQDSR